MLLERSVVTAYEDPFEMAYILAIDVNMTMLTKSLCVFTFPQHNGIKVFFNTLQWSELMWRDIILTTSS